MSQEKRALWVVFTPPDPKSVDEMRKMFEGSYPAFLEMEAVEFKCWWVDPDQGQWGAFYVFRSEVELQAYLTSERWTKVIPEKYGCVPTWRVLQPGPIIAKKLIGEFEGSWLS